MLPRLAPRLLACAGACIALTAAALPAHASPISDDFDFAWSGKIALDAEGLSSPDHRKRRKAVSDLGGYHISITAPYLLEALQDVDPRVRYEAGRILGEHRVLEAAPAIIQWLSDPDGGRRQEAAELLGALATNEAVAALIRTLGDAAPRVRQRAVQSLGAIGTPAVVVPLIGRLDDDKLEVRQAAVEQLEAIGDRRAVIPLVGAFNDPSLDVRRAAVRAVGRLGDRAAIPPLMRLLRDPAEEIRSSAVAALGSLEAVEAVDVLIEMLDQDKSDSFQAEVAYALGKIARSTPGATPAAPAATAAPAGAPATAAATIAATPAATVAAADRAVRTLVEALARRSLRSAAREALRNAGAVAVPALVAHLGGELVGDPGTAVTLLRDIGDPAATPALIAELERGRIDRALVLDALAHIGDRRALLPILGLLQTPDAPLRLQAMEALRPIIDDLRAADVLVGLLDDADLEIRVLAVEYLGLMRSRRAVPRLLQHITPDNAPRLRLAAVDALGEIGDPAAAGALVRLLDSGPAFLHGPAATALIYIGGAGQPNTEHVTEHIRALAALARRPHARGQAHAVRSLGGILRASAPSRAQSEVRALLQELTRSSDLAVALAAIDGLGAMGDASTVPALMALLGDDVHRRRAAAAALGNLGAPAPASEVGGDVGSITTALVELLATGDDRVSGDAAWALGKLADARALDALVQATRQRGWATAINATAALARYAPPARADVLERLLHHPDRLVRVNAATGLGRMKARRAREALLARLARDPSPLVRTAAARALSRIGGASVYSALARAAASDASDAVRQAARDGQSAPFAPPARTDWRSFHVIEPDRDGAPARQEPYFLAAADGLVTALYTDARGYAGEERFPPGPYVLAPRARTSRY